LESRQKVNQTKIKSNIPPFFGIKNYTSNSGLSLSIINLDNKMERIP